MIWNVIIALIGWLLFEKNHHNTHPEMMKSKMSITMDNVVDNTYWISSLDNGFHQVSKNGYFGLADSKLILRTEVKYDRIFSFNEGMAIVCKDNLYGVLDSTGKEVVAPSYQYLADYKNGLCFGLADNRVDVLLNKKGENLVTEKNTRIWGINGRYVQQDANYFFHAFNRSGERVSAVNMRALAKAGNELWKDQTNWWFIGGDRALVDLESRDAKDHGRFERKPEIPLDLPFYFNEGLALIPRFIDNEIRFGYIDETGKTVIPFIYENGQYFVNGCACVKKDGLWGVINKQGDWVIQPKYNHLKSTNGTYFIFGENQLQGVIDLKEVIKIKPIHLKIDHLFNDLFAVLESNELTKRNVYEYQNGFGVAPGMRSWGCINAQTATTVLPFEYNEILVVNDHIGSAWKYSFELMPGTNDYNSAVQTSEVTPRDYVGKATGTIFTSQGVKGSYTIPEVKLLNRTSDPKTMDIENLLLWEHKEPYILIGGKYIDSKGLLVKSDKSVPEAVVAENSFQKLMVSQDPSKKKYGVSSLKAKSILPSQFDKIEITPTGIIAKKNNRFGLYDFTGKLLLELKYLQIKELPAGTYEVSEDGITTVNINRKGIKIN